MIERHTGRGLIPDCDCEFCVAKRSATAVIGSAHHLMCTAKELGIPNPSSMRAYMLDPDAIENWIWQLRRAARRRAHATLQQLKEK